MNTIFQMLSYALKIRLMSTSSIAPSKKKKKKEWSAVQPAFIMI